MSVLDICSYDVAECQAWNVSFPEGTQLMTLTFDARCSTAHPGDKVMLFSSYDSERQLNLGTFGGKAGDSKTNWPRTSIVVPGRQMRVQFQSAR